MAAYSPLLQLCARHCRWCTTTLPPPLAGAAADRTSTPLSRCRWPGGPALAADSWVGPRRYSGGVKSVQHARQLVRQLMPLRRRPPQWISLLPTTMPSLGRRLTLCPDHSTTSRSSSGISRSSSRKATSSAAPQQQQQRLVRPSPTAAAIGGRCEAPACPLLGRPPRLRAWASRAMRNGSRLAAASELPGRRAAALWRQREATRHRLLRRQSGRGEPKRRLRGTRRCR